MRKTLMVIVALIATIIWSDSASASGRRDTRNFFKNQGRQVRGIGLDRGYGGYGSDRFPVRVDIDRYSYSDPEGRYTDTGVYVDTPYGSIGTRKEKVTPKKPVEGYGELGTTPAPRTPGPPPRRDFTPSRSEFFGK